MFGSMTNEELREAQRALSDEINRRLIECRESMSGRPQSDVLRAIARNFGKARATMECRRYQACSLLEAHDIVTNLLEGDDQ